MPDTDSVTLDDAAGGEEGAAGRKKTGVLNIKVLAAVFIMFVFVQSDLFVNSIVSGFGGAVNCRTPTPFGVIIQGIFLVLFLILSVYLVEGGIL